MKVNHYFLGSSSHGTPELSRSRDVLNNSFVNHGDHGGDKEASCGRTSNFLHCTFKRKFIKVMVVVVSEEPMSFVLLLFLRGRRSEVALALLLFFRRRVGKDVLADRGVHGGRFRKRMLLRDDETVLSIGKSKFVGRFGRRRPGCELRDRCCCCCRSEMMTQDMNQ